MTLKTSVLVNIILFVLLIVLWYSRQSRGGDDIAIGEWSKVLQRDTVVKLVYQDPIVITKTKVKIKKTRDTIILTPPFVMVFDTIVKRDTIMARFEYPEQLFSFAIRRSADTNYTERLLVSKEKPSMVFWEQTLTVIGAVAAGFLVGRIK